jgi:4-amino-4-deoxy-L-arabinose transferase-like glycosyltransferase
MDYLLFMGWAFLLCIALWLWLVGFDSRKMRRWAIITSIAVGLIAAFAIYGWNTKSCSEYMIDDYQHGDVPVSCVGTYNTVPDKSKY